MAPKNSSSSSTTILGISTTMILILTAALILSSITVDASSSSSSSSSTHHLLSWSTTTFQSTCEGSIGECSEEEFGMDSEINRRILATTQYISYEALKRNTAPCSRRGASYYNCKPGAAANPYTRGCSAITRCRS